MTQANEPETEEKPTKRAYKKPPTITEWLALEGLPESLAEGMTRVERATALALYHDVLDYNEIKAKADRASARANALFAEANTLRASQRALDDLRKTLKKRAEPTA